MVYECSRYVSWKLRQDDSDYDDNNLYLHYFNINKPCVINTSAVYLDFFS